MILSCGRICLMKFFPEKSFEYAKLDERTRNIVWQYTSEIKNLMRLTAENIISIGQKLTLVKSQLGHGNFQQWLKTEFEWSEQTARQFMQVYRWSETIENRNFVFSNLGTSALYLLAAPSTPSAARDEVLGLVNIGEQVSYTRAKNIISRYRELPLINNKDTEITDVEIKSQLSIQSEKTGNLLFRLEIFESGCIVKLYCANELEIISNLNIGAIVRIKVGRWQGHTAEIIEVLNEQQSTEKERLQTDTTLPTSLLLKTDISVETDINVSVSEVDFNDLQKLREMGQHLTIGYGDTCLAIKANPHTLATFTEKIKTDLEFVRDILQQALPRQNCQI